MEPADIGDINFSVRRQTSELNTPRKSVTVDPPTKDELTTFFETLNSSDLKPVILKIISPYCDQFIPKLCDNSLPPTISQLYNPEALSMKYMTLLSICEETAKTLMVRKNAS